MQLNQLNPQQRAAVLHAEGPALILAGAGSGKTRVLTQRIAYLVEEKGVSPYNILALTFTNRAAREMRDRIDDLVGSARGMFVGTFHSLCSLWLRMDGENIGIDRNFSIYDDADQMGVLTQCLKELNIDDKQFPRRMFSNRISKAKNAALSPDEFAKELGVDERDVVIRVYRLYEKKLQEYGGLDFDDLLMRAYELLTKAPDVAARYRERYRYVMVDEYQDTNGVQYKLLRALCQGDPNLCVVGDDDQSIYGWRGANIQNILNFEHDYPGTKVYYLTQNYRSTNRILDAANHVIANNHGRKEKKLWSELGDGYPIDVFSARDEYEEARYVCERAQRLMEEEGIPYSDMAVLYRTHALSRVLEELCISCQIPYRIYGGQRFYDRREIKDLVAYLRVLVNPRDDVSLRRVINTPRRSIGDTTVQRLSDAAQESGVSLMDALLGVDALPIEARSKAKLQAFSNMIAELIALSQTLPPTQLIAMLIERIEYVKYLQNDRDQNAQGRLENLDQFIASVADYEERADAPSLEDFLQTVALSTDMDVPDEGGTLTLMTLHSAKGLEFKAVFLVGMEEEIFPHVSSVLDEGELEEERRLCYVGMTRAQQRLILTHAAERRMRAERRRSKPSRFLKEIPDEHLNILRPYIYDRNGAQASPFAQEARQGGGSRGALQHKPGAAVKYKEAQRILHETFGQGTIVAVAGQGENAILSVAFDEGGIKKLSVAYAPIMPVED